MKVTTDACLFGAWAARKINNEELIINNCLDIGAGTGLLALMLAQKINARIDCIEIDRDAAKQASENVEASPWQARIAVTHGDVKNAVETFSKKFDVIISNPPFYEKELRSTSDNKNIAHHSEHLTLDELLDIIKNNLTPDGSFYLLLPYKRNEEIKKLFNNHQLHIVEIMLVRQSVNHDYFRIMLKGKINNKDNKQTELNEMSITNDKQQYTAEFVNLLKDYYLYL